MQISNWSAALNAPGCKDTASIQARLASLKVSRDETVNKLNLLITQQGNLIAMAMLEGGALAGLCKSLPI